MKLFPQVTLAKLVSCYWHHFILQVTGPNLCQSCGRYSLRGCFSCYSARGAHKDDTIWERCPKSLLCQAIMDIMSLSQELYRLWSNKGHSASFCLSLTLLHCLWLCHTDAYFTRAESAPPPLPGSKEYIALLTEKSEQMKADAIDMKEDDGVLRRPARTRTIMEDSEYPGVPDSQSVFGSDSPNKSYTPAYT